MNSINERIVELSRLQDFGPGMVALRNDIEKLQRRLESAEKAEQQWYDIAQGQDVEIEELRDALCLIHLDFANARDEINNLEVSIESLENRDKSIALKVAHDELRKTKHQLDTALIQVEKLRHAREVVSVAPVEKINIEEYGYQAAVSGCPVNPFNDGTEWEAEWDKGYERAMLDKEPEEFLEEVEFFEVMVTAEAKETKRRAGLSPEQQGRQAFHDPKALMDCPYKFAVDQVKHNQWMFGFTEAQHKFTRDDNPVSYGHTYKK